MVRGHRAASGLCRNPGIPLGTIRPQLRYFRGVPGFGQRFRGPLFPGTVNVKIPGRIVRVDNPAHVIGNVRWTRRIPAENFFLSPCFLVHRSRSYPGYLYIPDPKTKPGQPPPSGIVEVLTSRLAKLRYGQGIQLRYAKAAVRLIAGTSGLLRGRSAPFG